MRRLAPVLTLFALSPLIAEFLFGATPLSRLGALPLVSLIYGGGAVLVRELVRRRSAGWARVLALGAVYGLIEEGLVLQSIFNPTLYNAGLIGGRALGVNWLWTEWTLGYHAVWSISLPILLAETLFPERREQPWLGRTGVAVTAALYTLGVVAMAVITRRFVAPGYQAPVGPTVALVAVGAAVVIAALRRPSPPRTITLSPRAPSPLLVALTAAAAGVAWFALLYVPPGLRAGPAPWLLMAADLLLAAGLAVVMSRWAWSDVHRLALVAGALIPSGLYGFLRVTASNPRDRLALGLANLVALALLAVAARRRLATT